MDNAIVTEQLTKIFHTEQDRTLAVDHISFQVKPGTIMALLGPNGAGKTTTIRLIASLISPSDGHSYVNGKNSVTASLEVRASIGLSHEKPSFYKGLTGRRNLQFYGELYDVPRDILDERITRLAEEFDLSDAIDSPVGSYSKGMTQKLSVCKSLIHDAPVIILDEPWSGLSPGATRDLRRKIKSLGEDRDKTILITTHNLAQAEQVADELMIISGGKIIAQGTPQQLRNRYHVVPELHIMLDSPLPEHTKKLLELEFIEGIEVMHGGKDMTVRIQDFSHTPKLVELLVKEHGASIRQVREVIPSLEEIYLSLVEVDR